MTVVDVARLRAKLDAVNASPGGADYGKRVAELRHEAHMAMPALLGVVAERDRLAATVKRVEALADSMDRNGDPGCADLVLHVIGDAL